jgi:ParB-like chromosome segregation protein Spo0J
MAKSIKNNKLAESTGQINTLPEASKTVQMASKIVQMPLKSLILFSRNPRTHSDEQVEQIAASIREFGFTNPILLDGDNGIIAGHGRLLAAKQLGLEQVPCIELGYLSEAQKRSLIIADNKLALNAGWDENLLRLELTDLKEMGANLGLVGFDAMELADIMLGKDVEFKEYDESAADDVQLVTCPQCGHSFPK